MKRIDILSSLCELKKKHDAISIATMTSIPEWHLLGGADKKHIDVVNMGQAASIGLGLAIARPDKFVMVIDGDGSLMMELSILSVISSLQPHNLYHFVMNNGVYETTGGQMTPYIDWGLIGDTFDLTWDNELPTDLKHQGPYCITLITDRDVALPYPDINIEKQADKLHLELLHERYSRASMAISSKSDYSC